MGIAFIPRPMGTFSRGNSKGTKRMGLVVSTSTWLRKFLKGNTGMGTSMDQGRRSTGLGFKRVGFTRGARLWVRNYTSQWRGVLLRGYSGGRRGGGRARGWIWSWKGLFDSLIYLMEKEQQIQLKVSFSRKNSRSNIKETVNRNINNLNVSNITFNQNNANQQIREFHQSKYKL